MVRYGIQFHPRSVISVYIPYSVVDLKVRMRDGVEGETRRSAKVVEGVCAFQRYCCVMRVCALGNFSPKLGNV